MVAATGSGTAASRSGSTKKDGSDSGGNKGPQGRASSGPSSSGGGARSSGAGGAGGVRGGNSTGSAQHESAGSQARSGGSSPASSARSGPGGAGGVRSPSGGGTRQAQTSAKVGSSAPRGSILSNPSVVSSRFADPGVAGVPGGLLGRNQNILGPGRLMTVSGGALARTQNNQPFAGMKTPALSEAIAFADHLRNMGYGPLDIRSAYRSQAVQDALRAANPAAARAGRIARHSDHTTGMAFDATVPGMTNADLAREALAFGGFSKVMGYGTPSDLQGSHIHMSVGDTPTKALGSVGGQPTASLDPRGSMTVANFAAQGRPSMSQPAAPAPTLADAVRAPKMQDRIAPETPSFASSFPARPEYPGALPAAPTTSNFPGRPTVVGSFPAAPTTSNFPGRPEFPGSLPAARSMSSFPARPEYPGSLPAEDAQPSSFPARPTGIPGFQSRVASRPEFPGSYPAAPTTGNFPGRPSFPGRLPAEDAAPSTFPGRPEYPGSYPAAPSQAFASNFPARPEYPGSYPTRSQVAQGIPNQPGLETKNQTGGLLAGLGQAIKKATAAPVQKVENLVNTVKNNIANPGLRFLEPPQPGNPVLNGGVGGGGGDQPAQWTGQEPPQVVAQMQQHVEDVLRSYFTGELVNPVA